MSNETTPDFAHRFVPGSSNRTLLVILITARRQNSPVEWAIHEPLGSPDLRNPSAMNRSDPGFDTDGMVVGMTTNPKRQAQASVTGTIRSPSPALF